MVHAISGRKRNAVCVVDTAVRQVIGSIGYVDRVKVSPGATLKVDILVSFIFYGRCQLEEILVYTMEKIRGRVRSRVVQYYLPGGAFQIQGFQKYAGYDKD